MTREEKMVKLMRQKPLLQDLSYSDIWDGLYEINDKCSEFEWLDDDTILSAIDDNDELLNEYKLAFSDLSRKCETLSYNIRRSYDLPNYFDDCIVGLIGNRYKNSIMLYDEDEEDYSSLSSFDAKLATSDAGSRVMRNTKAEMLSKIGQCLGIVLAYWDIRVMYDKLEGIFDIVTSEDKTIREQISKINDLYEKVVVKYSATNYEKEEFENLLDFLPEKVWVQ